jgi:hypothetical protein
MHLKYAFVVLSFKNPEIQNSGIYRSVYIKHWEWRSWLRHCATSGKVAGSIQDGVIVWELQTTGNFRACSALYRNYFTFTLNIIRIVFVFLTTAFFFILAALHKILRYNTSKLNVLFHCNTTRESVTRPHRRAAVVVTLFCLVAVSVRCQEAAGA